MPSTKEKTPPVCVPGLPPYGAGGEPLGELPAPPPPVASRGVSQELIDQALENARLKRALADMSEPDRAQLFWLQVLTDLKTRGVQDVLVCCVDGLEGFPEAIEAVFPKAWVQTCIAQYADPPVMPTPAGKLLQIAGSPVGMSA